MGQKITCLFHADDGLILAKDKEKAERIIEIIREIGRKYGLQLNERKSQCILFNTKEKYETNKLYRSSRQNKILRSDSTSKEKCVRRTKERYDEKIKRLSVMTNSVIVKSCHRVMMGKTYRKEWCYQALCTEQK